MYSREHFRLLKIKNIYFKTTGGITTLIRIMNINPYTTNIISSNDIPEIGILCIEMENRLVQVLVTVIKDFTETNTYTLFHEDPLPDELIHGINKINEVMSSSDQRKEIRYEIGMKNWQQFGLSRADVFFTEKNNNQIKCIINNASIHGVLLTGVRSHIMIGEKVVFNCKFETQVQQQCIVINTASCGNGYFRYSLRFLEPLSFIWCNHIIDYGDFLENDVLYL